MIVHEAKRISAVILVAISLSGCKLQIVSGSGGAIIATPGSSSTGCAENSACEYDVDDTDFQGVYSAQARTGYVFSHWQAGDWYLCPGSTDETCELDNTVFAGNAGVEAIIASDQAFKLKAVFKRVSAPLLTLRDGTGQSIGTVVNFPQSSYVHALVSHENDQGIEHRYLLGFSKNGVNTESQIRGYWAEPSCAGEPTHLSSYDSDAPMTPFLSGPIQSNS